MILHLMENNNFTLSLKDFLIKHGSFSNHHFLILSQDDVKFTVQTSVLKTPMVKHFISNCKLFFKLCAKSEKIILHGSAMIYYLFLFPFFIKKVIWIINGYELILLNKTNVFYNKIAFSVLKKTKVHFTHIYEDSQIANKILRNNTSFIYSPSYLSNVVFIDDFEEFNITSNKKLKILIGNSTDPSNNHIEIFNIIENHLDSIDKIYCPLSYGEFYEYKKYIISEGEKRFGDKFIAITEFMSKEDYLSFLKIIDIAIFNHNRQQAMGVTLTLLSLGKIVYMKSGTSSFNSLLNRGFAIFDINSLSNNNIVTNYDLSINKTLLERYYSINMLVNSYLEI
jgi:dTDP-N-acetylfucosamine:lipid II N-acetylfucosaminyltransferase